LGTAGFCQASPRRSSPGLCDSPAFLVFMSTLIADLYTPIRAFLGDFNTTVRKYSDTAIADVVRTVVRCGHVPGITVDGAGTGLDPGLTTTLLYAQVVYQSCLKFVGPNIGSYSYRTRALGESFGNQSHFVLELQSALSAIENGAGFGAFIDFHTWAMSITGVPLWNMLTELRTNAPIATVTVGRDGITVSD